MAIEAPVLFAPSPTKFPHMGIRKVSSCTSLEAPGEYQVLISKNNGNGKIFPLVEDPNEDRVPDITHEQQRQVAQSSTTWNADIPFIFDNGDSVLNNDDVCNHQSRQNSLQAVENCGHCLQSDISSSQASASYSDSQTNPSPISQWRAFFRLWKQRSIRRFSTFPHIGVPKFPTRKHRSRDICLRSPKSSCDAKLCCSKPSWKNFTLLELQNATNNFNAENLIGKGGHAEVYKGCLDDGQLVAVKRLTWGTMEERTGDFLSEIGIIVHINHPNAAHLIGFGVEGGLHLVLQLSPCGSLESMLHGSKEKPNWSIRYKVALGVAKGLQYLHDSCPRRIIHRDIKASNILLTEDFEAQIADFGLAKWLPNQLTHLTVSQFEGTFGYMAPEYFMHGVVDEKTDVFSFGVLLLELITGRRAIDSSQKSLVMWCIFLLERKVAQSPTSKYKIQFLVERSLQANLREKVIV
ncbi:receptor-like cytosolic serine/threonine-protein kinase RBK2 isoform X2 [Amborella trichopoda]|uniref:receptor-like cytosolic serine/threonine-protein kinase RBK2 isoform X2 n=1 Tax=Amborella trichopoda TaxID=13333 RepID=UPI0009BD799C|nr:receptor-like cytosolic serine/threonine-protein kinase RBK2 isoform X2 [Amborella trichopoda]|eukprot:XP_020524198.1 receptor-like cytosolic serine/threonine-protein kinase RBK2 isoform X2 [Amborella trichopoda]